MMTVIAVIIEKSKVIFKINLINHNFHIVVHSMHLTPGCECCHDLGSRSVFRVTIQDCLIPLLMLYNWEVFLIFKVFLAFLLTSSCVGDNIIPFTYVVGIEKFVLLFSPYSFVFSLRIRKLKYI